MSTYRDPILVLLALLLLVPVGAFGLNLLSGPAENLPHAKGQTTTTATTTDQHQSADLSQTIERLAERLSAKPDDLDGWVLLARSYTAVNRFEEAADAYETALDLPGAGPETRSAYGEVLVLASRGTVTPEAKAVFDAVTQARPGDPRSRYYLALAEAQAGGGAKAIEMWQALEADSPPGASWLPILRQRMDSTAKQYGIALAPGPGPSAPMAGPDAGDPHQASGIGAGEQDEMIRGMVARLAARLEEAPDDAQGWLRLGRSYAVLGEREKARAAYGEALNRQPSNMELLRSYGDAILETGRESAVLALPEASVTVLRNLLAVDPGNPQALWILALVESEAGDPGAAEALWRRLLTSLPPGSPRRALVTAELERLQGQR